MFLGIKNASGGPKIDIGGPGPKPYINVTFWGDFLIQRQKNQFWSGKVRFGPEFSFFSVLGRSVWSWEAQKPQYSYRNIEVSIPGRPGTPQNP